MMPKVCVVEKDEITRLRAIVDDIRAWAELVLTQPQPKHRVGRLTLTEEAAREIRFICKGAR